MGLEDKIALVTGAWHSLGRAVSSGLTREGARVTLAEIDSGG